MLAYGKLPRDAMGSAGKLFSIGIEFSGKVSLLVTMISPFKVHVQFRNRQKAIWIYKH
jgi:hypothetical protein